MATCPMCRTKLCPDVHEPVGFSNTLDEGSMANETDSDGDAFFEESIHMHEMAETNGILAQMNMSMYEEIMHDHMMEVIEIHAMNYCHANQHDYMGRINLHIITKEESNHYYERIEAGTTTPNSYYMIELMRPTPNPLSYESSNEVRYRFGRIEEITSHHLLPDSKWYAFRERIDRIDEERGQFTSEWANEIQHISLDAVKVLIHYCPKIRLHA